MRLLLLVVNPSQKLECAQSSDEVVALFVGEEWCGHFLFAYPRAFADDEVDL
jgi:hypothetical protein